MSDNVKYAVDGYFLTKNISGIQRYSLELLAEADKLLQPGELEIVVPVGTAVPPYKNIRAVHYGKPGKLWEQLSYPKYLKQAGRRWLCTCNVIPIFAGGAGGAVIIHDVCYRARPDFYTSLRGRLSALWHRLQYRLAVKNARIIITDSQFSKSEIIKYYHADTAKITVIHGAWQHMQRVAADDSVFAGQGKWPQLKRGGYYFSMANLLKNKNFPWVLRAAKNSPQSIFAIAGSGSLNAEAERLGLGNLPNVIYLGYVTDGEAKALMANCKAFLFPTLYEGFGMPPMEAAACGAGQVIISDTPCMREIYGVNASYIDLGQNPGNVEDVPPCENAAGVLARYSWQESARQLVALLHSGK